MKEDALRSLSTFINSQDPKHQQILAYWVRDYVRFLEKEADFDPLQLIRYKRGSIVKVHLGYRIGSEEGGLHYAVVIDTNNAQSSQTATVIPLTSVKQHTDLERLHHSKLYLGNEIYQSLNDKADQINRAILEEYTLTVKRVTELEARAPAEESPEYAKWEAEAQAVLEETRLHTESINNRIANLQRVRKEILRMKAGSIALVGQITTISKIRIYDPLYPSDTLTNIRLSPSSLDRIDEKIKQLYTKPLH